ncbi:MAG: polysaccharide deacetylase family protein, partial [Pseudomonadales bacterium]
FFPLQNRGGASLLQLVPGESLVQDAVGLSWWGGYALSPFPIMSIPDEQGSRWVLDPIQFFQRALQLQPFPIPETTTRYGRRLMLVHVDGDGFPSRVEFADASAKIEYAGEMLLDDILGHYTIPTTVSIIEGEIGGAGLYPKLSKRLEHASKSIFALPHVEIASHSYSHPFAWQPAYTQGVKQPQLPIPGYTFTPDRLVREIKGSVHYIDQQLAPPNKSTKVFLWTGDCNPSTEALRLAYNQGLANMNGGDTIITKQNNSLTAVAPLGIQKGRYLQVYAPNQNENMYTNLWKGPFYGYQQVIETFQLTELPRRYKPINIYYHTYSASKKASLTALHKVYDWALAQPVNHIFASEYVQLVQDFSRMVVTQSKSGWQLLNLETATEIRVPQSAGYPDLHASQGVIGYVDHGSERYVHLDQSRSPFLVLTPDGPTQPFLASTNGDVMKWNRTQDGIEVSLKGHGSLTSVMGNVTSCEVLQGSSPTQQKIDGSYLMLRFGEGQNEVVSITCR